MWRSVIFGVFVHVLMLYSVFDIYFVSPIYHGMTPHKSGALPLAKRVVLFVSDGLRASSLYGEDMKINAPFLSYAIDFLGSHGIAHTQVPTESRPGHVALLAGFNEDPSAITKGWQSNPVEFDSVINQSSNAWCWGSPDIVDMFNKDNLSHIHLNSYDASMQDFSGKNNSIAALDIWVFEKVSSFIQSQTTCTKLCESGNILFLHLLGLDTAGHSLKPTSPSYVENIKVVDSGVKDIVHLVDNYFNDSMTAYVFTSDHGMTNWGSHGDGSEDETDVPFIIWGAGIIRNSIPVHIEQINIASLLSSLLSINIPINSFGIVPLDLFNSTQSTKAHMIVANARQLSEQYLKKHTTLQDSTMKWTFRPYPNFLDFTLVEHLKRLESFMETKDYDRSIIKAYEIIRLCKEGISYYLGYYQNLLLFFVTFGFVGWIFYLFISIIKFKMLFDNTEQSMQLNKRHPKLLKITSFIVYILLTFVCVLMFAQSLPIKYYIYCVFCFTWLAVGQNLKTIFKFFSLFSRSNWYTYLYSFMGYTIGIELLVATFFVRDYISLLLLYYFWKCYKEKYIYKDYYDWLIDLITVLVLAVCPVVLQLQTRFSYRSLFLSLLLWTDTNYNIMKRFLTVSDRRIFIFQFGFLYLAFINAICVNLAITYGYGLLMVNQMISWILLAITPILPLLISTKLSNRLLSAVVALMIPYTLMAVGYEHLFMHFFVRLILNWSSKESMRKVQKTSSHINTVLVGHTDDRSINNCFYLLVFLMFSYFGVGNTASVSSFDPMWTRCFVTVFSPFTMAGLILIKLMIPFLIVLCGFRSVIISINGQLYNCFLTLLLFCDIMVLHFLYFVKNEGSWLEIGRAQNRKLPSSVHCAIIECRIMSSVYDFNKPSTSRAGIVPSRCFIPLKRIKLKYEEDGSESSESVYSIQGYETDFVIDTPDTDTKSEDSYSYSNLFSNDEFELEYDVRSLSGVEADDIPIGVDSSSEAEDIRQLTSGAISVNQALNVLNQHESSLREGEDSDSSTSQVIVHKTRYHHCLQCKVLNNNPSFRYCRKCFKARKEFFPARPRGHKKKNRNIENCSENVVANITQEENIINQDKSKSNLCFICKEVANTVFEHGLVAHMCCCYNCAMKCWNLNKRCPSCNGIANNVVKAFVS
ncbi:hypothetical protein FQR65_LT04659 [Abscondita terminalis]|nr:hypothetical protein FQR65_LT04659 [Abscondita terminalis]